MNATPQSQDMENMTNLEKQIECWHRAAFGKTVNLPATLKKLGEEFGELAEAIIEGDPIHIQEEAGDMAFVLAHIVRGACPQHPSLQTAMAVVLDKNERRSREARVDMLANGNFEYAGSITGVDK